MNTSTGALLIRNSRQAGKKPIRFIENLSRAEDKRRHSVPVRQYQGREDYEHLPRNNL